MGHFAKWALNVKSVIVSHGSAEWPVFVIAARRGNSATDDTYGHVGTRKYENQKKMMKDC